jgi:SAM-dependent methyltransferase
MSNDEVYAAGLLNRALDPSTQPPEIQAFLEAEFEVLGEAVADGAQVLDVGCGTGRHLLRFSGRLGFGLGVDYEHAYIAEAARRAGNAPLRFVTCDATAIPVAARFDLALCVTNTWGTMSDKVGVLKEMRRLSPRPGSRLISVYSETSVAPRREWYRRLGHVVREETPEYLASDGGFRSEHFTQARLRAIVGDCAIHLLTRIAYVVRF